MRNRIAPVRFLAALLIPLAVFVSAGSVSALNTKHEAETMTQPAGALVRDDSSASGGKYLEVGANGSATKAFSSSVSEVVVRARGDQCEGAAQMRVYVDSTLVGSSAVSSATSWADFTYSNLSIAGGSHTLTIEYFNDQMQPGCDRDLHLDNFVITDTPPPSDADGDGIPAAGDNCPDTANAGQSDVDGDGTGDACDPTDDRPDSDGDSIKDAEDVCPNEPGPASNNGCPEPPSDGAFKLEAETMSLPAGASVIDDAAASGGKAIHFTQAGNASASVTLSEPVDRIVVVAKAPQGGSPDLELKVNGVDQLGNGVPVRSTAYADYPVNKALGTGTYNITIRTDAGISPSTPLDVDVSRFEGAGASPPPPPPPAAGSVTGELKKWHPVTISFNGPPSTETNSSPNPFLDYRLQVSFTSPSGKSFEVPGFYDGGSDWKVRFNPDESGTWGYKASFRQGANVAIDTSPTAGTPTSFDGASGTFDIAPRDASAPGFLKEGELEYVGEHYLKFRDGSYWLKGGADSPENWLGYAGFDNTPNAKHSFSPHVQDWKSGDPIFNPSSADGGKGFIGALNYVSSQGINSIYFLPMNIGGDGRDSSPYVSVSNWGGSTANDNLHFDVSKLAQWEQAFAHAQKKGIMLHFVLNEAEQANKQELDGGSLGSERKLFYREMIARFGHHNALQWNISEEYESPYNLGTENVKSFAGYIQSVDPYDHPVTVHNYIDPDTTWTPFLGDSRFSLTSFQYVESYAGYGAEVEEWRSKTAQAGRPLPIGMDEVITATTTNAADMRRGVLWPTYLSGGNLEWYIGAEDQSLEDFRRYGQLWAYTRHARTFMEDNLPFWEMQPQDGLLSGESSDYGGGQVFTKASEVYAVYLPNASSTGTLDLSGVSGSFQKRWYNPRSGAFEGSPQAVSGGGRRSVVHIQAG